MKIMIAGDWHTDHDHAVRLLTICVQKDISLIIQVGDFGFLWNSEEDLDRLNDMAAEFGIEIWWIDGNHENYSLMGMVGADHVGEEAVWIRSNVRYLPRGFRFQIDGCRFMAFGGGISMDRDGRQSGRSYFFQEAITTYQVDGVTNEPVDIFLSHDVPAGVRTIDAHDEATNHMWPDDAVRDSMFNRVLLAEVVDKVQPKLIVHGHRHHFYRDQRRGAEVIGLDCNKADAVARSYTVIDTEDYRG